MSWPLRRRQAATAERDWYYDADPARRREYDAFGPWIGVVKSFDEMPPRFQHAYDELRASTFLFKMPIKADRRAVRPGMDLYRAVLAVSEGRVVVLEWDGSTETRYESAVDQIQAIRVDQDLLPATLSLLLADGRTVSLEYSSVSDKEIEQVVEFLRERMSPGARTHRDPSTNVPERPEIDIGESFYLSMWWKHIRRSPAARVRYWEPSGIRLGGLRSSLGSLFLDTGSDLVIIHRGRFVRRWLEAVYSSAEVYVPWSSVRSIALIQLPKGRQRLVPALRIAVGGHDVTVELYGPGSERQRLLDYCSSVLR